MTACPTPSPLAVPDQIRASATWGEIHSQPDVWRAWADAVVLGETRAWVRSLDLEEIWFCGAGTSAYIGDIIAAAALELDTGGIRVRSVASTDLVARPNAYLGGLKKTLVVNFGRSGNSAESLGTLAAMDALAPDAPQLHITCNRNGALAARNDHRVLLLPDACHDAGFAMTSSFTTMFVSALSVLIEDAADQIKALARTAGETLPQFEAQVAQMGRPARVVYVGSGPMAFVARECALKVMELSAGQIPALWDSTLGFRHGPKSFVQDGTAIHVLLSRDPHALKYDLDLVAELSAQFPNAAVITIGAGGDFDTLDAAQSPWDSALSVLPAQLQSVHWSAALKLNIDDPFVGQSTLSRVVSDVTLHPVGGLS